MLYNSLRVKKSLRASCFLFCLLIILSVSRPCAQAADDVAAQKLYDRFSSTIEKNWKNRVKTLLQYSGSTSTFIQTQLPSKNSNEDPTLVEIKASWNSDYPGFVVENADGSPGSDPNAPNTVFGCNEKYSFVLAKDPVSQQWTIEKIDPIARRVRFDDIWNFLSNGSIPGNHPRELYLAYSASCLSEFFLPDESSVMSLFSSPSFVVEKYETTDEGNLKISFSIKKSETKTDKRFTPIMFQSGSVEFSPDDWRIVAATTSYGKWEQTTTYQYKLEGKTHLLTSKICKTTYGDGRTDQNEFTFEPVKKSNAADRFLVSYYGFPEPDFGTKSSNWVRLLLLAIGVLLTATYAWKIYRKRENNK